MKPLLIAFDLDDTLIAEQDYILAAFTEIAGQGLCDFSSIKDYTNAYSAIEEQIPEENREKAISIYRSGEFCIKPVAGVEEVLSVLKEQGAKLALITDGWSQRQRAKLSRSGLSDFFEYIYISEENDNQQKLTGKPFNIINGLYPDCEKIYVGDNPAKDFIKAKEAGWKTIMIRNPEILYVHPETIPGRSHAPDLKLSSIKQLLSKL